MTLSANRAPEPGQHLGAEPGGVPDAPGSDRRRQDRLRRSRRAR